MDIKNKKVDYLHLRGYCSLDFLQGNRKTGKNWNGGLIR